eukprot:COSAG02_NODE_64570_length_260_cov_0.639752_1_plen_66_part_01
MITSEVHEAKAKKQERHKAKARKKKEEQEQVPPHFSSHFPTIFLSVSVNSCVLVTRSPSDDFCAVE